jgi:G3E family GTPase
MKVPVIVLSGFLGSGKTTLLLHLIEESRKRRLHPGILMNELGKHDVDGQILLDLSPKLSLEKLLDGCICCSKKSEVADSLSNLLRKNTDVIFIELTGVANPEEIADCLTEPQLLNKMYLKQIITILDAENVLDYNSIFQTDKNLVHTLRRQIETADLLIVNKTDLVKQAQLEKVEKAVRKQNTKAHIYFTTKSKIDLEPIFINLMPLEKKPQTFSRFQVLEGTPLSAYNSEPNNPHHHKDEHKELSYSRVQTITLPYKPNHPISLKHLERFFQNLGPQLIRAKGYLSLKAGGPVALMQYAAKRMTWEPIPYNDLQYVVFIGIEFDLKRLTAEWNQFIGQVTAI